jgi:hypothetical protein
MYQIERKKILKEKLNELQEYRENKEWDINNGDDISYETEALYNHLSQNREIGTYDNEDGEEVKEDKYFIYKTKYGGYGNSNMFEWLGDSLFESEWVVYSDDDIESAAYEKIKSDIEDLGYEAFGIGVWESNLDMSEVRRWLYDIHEDAEYNEIMDYRHFRNYLQNYVSWLLNEPEFIDRQPLTTCQKEIDKLKHWLETIPARYDLATRFRHPRYQEHHSGAQGHDPCRDHYYGLL